VLEVEGTFKHRQRYLVVLHRSAAIRVRPERLHLRRLISDARRLVDLQVEMITSDNPEEVLTRVQTRTSEHCPSADVERFELVEHELPKPFAAS
jgi:hypothetical protein